MFWPYLGFVKDRLSSWLSIQTLNNFGGIIGKFFNFGRWSIIFQLHHKILKNHKKSGTLTTTVSTLWCAPPRTTTLFWHRPKLLASNPLRNLNLIFKQLFWVWPHFKTTLRPLFILLFFFVVQLYFLKNRYVCIFF